MNFSLRRSLTAMAVALLIPASAFASGFSVYEQSAAASGRAGAWTAGVDDAAANWYNPAALAWLDGSEVQFGINGIFAGYDTELTTSDPEILVMQETTFGAEGHAVTPIHLYYGSRISDTLSWGLGINNPYGLISEWDEQPIPVFFRKGSLVTFVVNPNLALRLSDNWSVAAGLDYVYAEVQDFSADVALGVNPQGPSFIIGGTRNLTGEGDDLGWNVAVSYRGDVVRAGLTYRSGLSPEIDGDLTFTESLIPPLSNSPATAELNLAPQAALGVAWDATDQLEIEIDLAWAGWSDFDQLAIDVQNEIPGLLGDFALRQNWDDTFSYRVGASWHQNASHEWRFGALWDESPIPSDTLRPSIPDSDRWAPTIGYGYTGSRWTVDVYYMYLVFTDADAQGNIQEGVIDGTYSSAGHITGITIGWRL